MPKSTKYENIEIFDNGITHYDSGMKKWSKEEVGIINDLYYEEANKYIQQALEDGYIEFPIMWENEAGEAIWSACYLPPTFKPSHSAGYKEANGLKYNIYIPSYKRAGITLTDKTLDYFGITNYYFCVDPDQYPAYKEAYGMEKVIIRDHTFKKGGKTNKLSSINSPHYLIAGSAFMNALLYMTKCLGDDKYWMLDDDIFSIGLKAPKLSNKKYNEYKYTGYRKEDYYRASSLLTDKVDFDLKEMMADMEDLSDECRNVDFIALEKMGIVFDKPIGPTRFGTRAYSFFLADARTQEDERGFQNNDTITSIDSEIGGRTVILFEGFMYDSLDSQSMPGGCHGSYTTMGTLDKTKSLVAAHPNVSKITYLNSRIHHVVDYSPFTKIKIKGIAKNK